MEHRAEAGPGRASPPGSSLKAALGRQGSGSPKELEGKRPLDVLMQFYALFRVFTAPLAHRSLCVDARSARGMSLDLSGPPWESSFAGESWINVPQHALQISSEVADMTASYEHFTVGLY